MATQAGFFLAPVIYPLGVIPERFHLWLFLWPPTPVIEFARGSVGGWHAADPARARVPRAHGRRPARWRFGHLSPLRREVGGVPVSATLIDVEEVTGLPGSSMQHRYGPGGTWHLGRGALRVTPSASIG